MNVDKAKKRIEKLVKKGFKGYPVVAIEYFGSSKDCATEVVMTFTAEENVDAQTQKFVSKNDARTDETIQSVLVKTIERTNANTVTEVTGISLIK
jgi:hypothetical protein